MPVGNALTIGVLCFLGADLWPPGLWKMDLHLTIDPSEKTVRVTLAIDLEMSWTSQATTVILGPLNLYQVIFKLKSLSTAPVSSVLP